MSQGSQSTVSPPGPSTPARTPTRPPARPSCRSTPRRPTRRPARASTRATNTRAAATRRGRPWKRAWPRSKAANAAWLSPRGLAATTAVFCATAQARRRSRGGGRPLRRHVSPARTRLQAVGACRPLHRRSHRSPASPRSSRRRRSWSGSRRRPTRCCKSSTSRPWRNWPTKHERCWRSITPSRRRICSSRSSWADLVVHSTTKYLGGHSDVVGGAVIGVEEFAGTDQVLPERGRRRAGAVRRLSDAARHQDAGRAHGATLRKCPQPCRLAASPSAVEQVYYPGLPNHPGHEIAKRQMRDFGGMISLRLKGGPEAAQHL